MNEIIRVYTVLVKEGEAHFNNKEEALKRGKIHSTRTFKTAGSYARFFFKYNNKLSNLETPSCDGYRMK